MRIELSSTARRGGPAQWITQWLVSALGLTLAARWLPGVSLSATGTQALLIVLGAAAVLGLLNVLVKPLLILITLPINILSLGLFTLVINGGVLLMAASLVQGFEIRGFADAVLAALFLSIFNLILNALMGSTRLRVERGEGS
jgi:putative membrane protein